MARALVVLGLFGLIASSTSTARETAPLPALKPPLHPSAGCGLAPPAEPPASLRVEGRTRRLITVIPADYRPERAHQVVVAFHGRTGPSRVARSYFDLESHARRPTIFVYPSGLKGDDGGFTWWDAGDGNDGLRDFALFDALLERLARTYCLDLDRVFAVGHSLGASFVNSLGCARGDRLRAIGTLAGGVISSSCRGRVAAVLFHNPNDQLVDFGHGLRTRRLYLIENGLDGGTPVSRGKFSCTRYGAGGTPDPVLWCPHTRNYAHGEYYPHQWPDGAGALIMAFFERLPQNPHARLASAATEAPRTVARPGLAKPGRTSP